MSPSDLFLCAGAAGQAVALQLSSRVTETLGRYDTHGEGRSGPATRKFRAAGRTCVFCVACHTVAVRKMPTPVVEQGQGADGIFKGAGEIVVQQSVWLAGR